MVGTILVGTAGQGTLRSVDAVLPATPEAPAKHIVLTVNSVCESSDDARTFSCKASKDRFDGHYYTRTMQVAWTPFVATIDAHPQSIN